LYKSQKKLWLAMVDMPRDPFTFLARRVKGRKGKMLIELFDEDSVIVHPLSTLFKVTLDHDPFNARTEEASNEWDI